MKHYKIADFLLLKLRLVEREEGKEDFFGTQWGLQGECWSGLVDLAAGLCKFLGYL